MKNLFSTVVVILAVAGALPIAGCQTTAEDKKNMDTQSRVQELLRLGDKDLSLDGENLKVLLGLGKSLISLDRSEQAMKPFQKAIELYPGDYRGYSGYGVSLDMLGRHDEAQAQYRKGYKIAPNSIALPNNLALSLASVGKYPAAIGILKILADDPASSIRLRQNLALVYGLAGMEEDAARINAIDIDPAGIANNLAYYRQIRKLSSQARAQAIFGAEN
jgi:Flp pilus assembly protein TadD